MSLYPKIGDSFYLSSDDEVDNGDGFDFGGDSSTLGRPELCSKEAQVQKKVPRVNHSETEIPGGSSCPEAPQRSGRNSNATLSLEDFEQKYLDRRHNSQNRHKSSPSLGRRSRSGSSTRPHHVTLVERLQHTVCRGVLWLEHTSKLKVVLVGCVLGLVCAVVWGELQLGTPSKDNHIPCSLENEFEPCLVKSQLKPALQFAHAIRDHLHSRAGRYECGDEGVPSPAVSLEELQTLLPGATEHNSQPHVMQHVFYLFLYNPHWGIRWMDSQRRNITDWTHRPGGEDLLESVSPRVSLLCRASQLVTAMWMRVRIAIVVLLAVVVLIVGIRWYTHRREQELQAVYMMVDRIMEVLRHHYETTIRRKDLVPYLAIIHVRDMLIPPSERKQKQQLWEKSCQWIATHESRVRVENRRMAGEDFQVWRWIQVDPPQTEEPDSNSKSHRRNFWQGRAFEDYPPGIDSKVAPPAGTPSPCVRLKNMFETTRHMNDEQALEIENSVLDRCIHHGGVVHIFVDRKSTFGCVYLKMDFIKSAMGAYKALHGGWYKGKLVTAKYIPESKYHKWFPHAASAKKHLYPT